MKSLFTIHAGEYLVGSYVEKRLGHVEVWLPSKDTGIDLLLTNRRKSKTASLQVKFSKDFLASDMSSDFQQDLLSCEWHQPRSEHFYVHLSGSPRPEYWYSIMRRRQ